MLCVVLRLCAVETAVLLFREDVPVRFLDDEVPVKLLEVDVLVESLLLSSPLYVADVLEEPE